MAKIEPGDLKAILRLYKVDYSDDTDHRIDQIETMTTPSSVGSITSFRFNKRRYCVLFDETAQDDLEYMTEQIGHVTTSKEGAFVLNPQENYATYGVPFKGKTVYLYLAQADKRRLDIVLSERDPSLSRSTWQKHIKAGYVSVNGTATTQTRFEVGNDDIITVNIPQKEDFSEETLPIIYLDDNVIVINKPAGVLSHSKGELNEEFTVADFFRSYTAVGLDTNRPGIVHRLDRDTSGVMIGVRNENAGKLLSRQFANRKTKKTYIAVLSGHLKEKEAVLELPIDRNPASPSTFRVAAGGKMAVTQYKVLAENDKESLVELKPVTGRTHQLRVHMAYLGAPIKGDRVYGRVGERLFLHARTLEITIPDGERKVFEAPLPSIFTNGFKDLTWK